MTRAAWIVVIVLVGAAAVVGTVGVVAMDRGGGPPVGQRAMLHHGPFSRGDRDGRALPFGLRARDGDRFGPGVRIAALGGDPWRPLYGFPWLAAGLLVGFGAALLAWQPWKQRAAAVAAAAGDDDTAASAAADTAMMSPEQQWAAWHREVHASEEAQERVDAAAEATTAIVTAGEAESADEVKPDGGDSAASSQHDAGAARA